MSRDKKLILPLSRPRLAWPVVTLLASLYIVLFDNQLFWASFVNKLGPDWQIHWALLIIFGTTLLLLLNLVFTLVAFRRVLKPFVAMILLLSANVSYFADTFGVVVDQSMIHNILETDIAEASEFLTWPLFWHLVLYAGFPILLLLLAKVKYYGWKREAVMRGSVLAGSVVLVAALAFPNFKEITFFGRENRDLRMYINPTFVIHSLKKVIKTTYFMQTDHPLERVATDARREDVDPKEVVVLVVGETARAQSFSLNGYRRETNPLLNNEGIVNFSHVESCGTSTAESLPCMFSLQERSNYSRREAMNSENLLDVLRRTGVNVVWRDNDSGSKGVANRVTYKDLSHQSVANTCSEDNCYDEILLQGLESELASISGDGLIVLHTKGSHGPSYYKRTPPEFKRFLPECAQDNVQDCSEQEIVNAYDNTIVYTDYLLDELIKILNQQDFATAMLYVSDHGESLGENGIFLHGLPYALAPKEQTQVPMLFWASDKFYGMKNITGDALANKSRNNFSHDNLFHSILGLFDVKTESYDQDLDIFAPSRLTVSNHEGMSSDRGS
jgi:lipid A ethanolaminephosphotransferase